MKTWYNDATMRFQIDRDIARAKTARVSLESEYLSTHANIAAMLANLTEFVNSMPAPNDDNEVPQSVNWAVLGDYKQIEAALVEVSKVADQLGK